jgi:hypothetical protein
MKEKYTLLNYRLILISCLYLLFSQSEIHGQFPVQKDPVVAKDAMNRKLVIVKPEPSKALIKKSRKAGKEADLMEEYKALNQRIFTYYQKLWNANADISMVSKIGLDSLQDLKSDDYIYAAYGLTYETDNDYTKVLANNKKQKVVKYYYYYSFYLGLTDRKSQALGIAYTRGRPLDDLDIVYGISVTQYLMKFIANGSNIKEVETIVNKGSNKLKGKTLLIPDYLADIPQEEMEAVYPYKIKIVPAQEIIEHLLTKNDEYAFLNLAHVEGSGGQKFHTFVIDCRTSEPILLDQKSRFSFTDKYEEGRMFFEDYFQDEKTRRAKVVRTQKLKEIADIIATNS